VRGAREVAFVIPHPYVDALACFREPIRAIAQAGWRVDLFTVPSSNHPPPVFDSENVRVRPIELTRGATVHLIAALLAHRPRYQWIFAVPQWSLHYAGLAASLARIPLVCISDEIAVEAEALTDSQRQWKSRERRAHQHCAFTIALSAARGVLIREENRLPDDQPILVVPNSAPGPAERLPSHFFQDTLGIPFDTFVVLHAGSWWWKLEFGAVEEVARHWGPDVVLAFQGRLRDGALAVPDHNPNIRFGSTLLPSTLLDYAVSSAHVGLALYDAKTANHREVGTASGKIALYMKNGLPVITTAQPSLAWIEREGCGVCINDVREIGAAVSRIREDYDGCVANVKRCYDQYFNFNRAFAPVLARLEAGA
jgi:hypothetical protein